MASITHRASLGRNLTADEVDANFDALNADINADTTFSYDASTPKKLTGYVKGGVTYTVTAPDSTHIVITGGGKTVTLTFDASGNCVSRVTA